MIELATVKDISQAQTLAQIAQKSCAALWTKEQFEEEIKLSCSQIFLYQTQEKELIAFISFRIYKDEGELTNFAVLPTEQNKKIGTQLLTFALTYLLNKGVKKITLEVSAQNLKAKKLYTNFGFKKVALRKNFYKGDIDAELMLLTLQNSL